jgi:hypothetical protein
LTEVLLLFNVSLFGVETQVTLIIVPKPMSDLLRFRTQALKHDFIKKGDKQV